MPEFDTYKAIERFAKDNNDASALLAYKCLKHRTEAMIRWRVASAMPLDGAAALNSYMGITNQATAPKDLSGMSEEARRALYVNACAQLGVKIDPASFTKNT